MDGGGGGNGHFVKIEKIIKSKSSQHPKVLRAGQGTQCTGLMISLLSRV